MTLARISPDDARRLVEKGAVLVDIREPDEHARECIQGALNRPVGKLTKLNGTGSPVIYFCRAGNRTATNAARLAAAADCQAYTLEGGIEGWKRAGLPVVTDLSQPIEIMRQVQIAAGSLVLTSMLLGLFVHPAFYGIALFVGAGLLFAGLTGWCGMAKLLARMPWNRRATAKG
jgi:rhodanese-related sulfurtransferase